VRVALDTNVLAYAEGVNGPSMKALALELVDGLPPGSVILPVQTLGELFQVLVRKAGRSRPSARAAILSWRDAFSLFETSAATILAAADLAVTHQLGIWDAVILSAAAEADCHLLLSEDMQDGFVWRGVTIANPFGRTKHPLLQALLSEDP
jgi:predicted nucleic acid-binding protein